MKYDVIVVGAGFAGSVMARCFAEDEKKVLVIDKRNHIGGNMHENIRDNGVRVHTYDHISFILMIKKYLTT